MSKGNGTGSLPEKQSASGIFAMIPGKPAEELERRGLDGPWHLAEDTLPDAQQLLDVMSESFQDRGDAHGGLADAGQDEVASAWAPMVQSQWEELPPEEKKGERPRRRILRKTVARIDRKWARLIDLHPDQQESLAETLASLTRDLEMWRAEVEQLADDPPALERILDEQTRSLEARIEAAYRQVLRERRRPGADDASGTRLTLAGKVRRVFSSMRGRLRKSDGSPSGPEDDEGDGTGHLSDQEVDLALGLESDQVNQSEEDMLDALADDEEGLTDNSISQEMGLALGLESDQVNQSEEEAPVASLVSGEQPPDGLKGDEEGWIAGAEKVDTAAGLDEGDEEAPVRDAPAYLQAMSHLQTGEWQQAIDCLEQMLETHPDSELVQRALEEARFKNNVDATTRVRAKYWIVPWGRLAFYLSAVVITVLLMITGARAFKKQVTPVLAEFQLERQIEQLRKEWKALRDAGALDAAEASCKALLDLDPTDEEAVQGLRDIAQQREIERLYEKARNLEAQGDNVTEEEWDEAGSYFEAAVKEYTDILLRSPEYRDVRLRITAINEKLKLGDLFVDAETDYEAGRFQEALDKYQQVRQLNGRYHRDLLDSHLYQIYIHLGREIVERDPPAPEMLPSAREYFEQALRLEPRSTEAMLEKRLASLFIEGQSRHYQGLSGEAITWLRQVYDRRPGYLGGMVVEMLYDAYIKTGDASRDAGDIGLAYEQYRKAADLPVLDKTLARARLNEMLPYLTPTPTATVTPTPTRTPLPTATPVPTPVPPPKPLTAYHGYIAFYSANEERPGIWVMDASGGNRHYLGKSVSLRKQYDALVEEARYSPDRRYKLVVQPARKNAQIFILLPRHEQYGDLPPKEISKLTGLCYDPVWSPDGSRVAFVSQENESDDIWVVNADGTNSRNLTRNSWEWDKHPSWSPDSRRIVFWSNRESLKQIYVMDADGRNARNISNTEWEEYDPIWIK